MWRKCGGFTWYYTPCWLETRCLHCSICDGICFLGGWDGVKAMIQNRKVVFVLIAVMTHSSVLHLSGKQAQLVELSFVFLVKRACIVLHSALYHCDYLQMSLKTPTSWIKPDNGLLKWISLNPIQKFHLVETLYWSLTLHSYFTIPCWQCLIDCKDINKTAYVQIGQREREIFTEWLFLWLCFRSASKDCFYSQLLVRLLTQC